MNFKGGSNYCKEGIKQGPKGMPDQEISVQNKDKQPKNLKK